MVSQQDTPRRPAPEPAAGARRQLVLEVSPALPSAQAAEQVLGAWLQGWPGRPVSLVRVPERRYAALVEHLRPRFLKLEPSPGPFPGFADRLRTGLDDGATLVAGGRTLEDGSAEPTLLLNLDPAARLLRSPQPSGPLLAVLRSEDGPAPADGPAQETLRLDPDPQP